MPSDAISVFAGACLGVFIASYLYAGTTLLLARILHLDIVMVLFGPWLWFRTGANLRRVRAGRRIAPSLIVDVAPKDGNWPKGALALITFIPGAVCLLTAGGITILTRPSLGPQTEGALSFGLALVLAVFGALMMVIGGYRAFMPSKALITADTTQLIRLTRIPIRPRDWDRALVERRLATVTTNANDLWIFIIAYSHFWDSGEKERAFEILQRGETYARRNQVLAGNRRSFWYEMGFAYGHLYRDLRAAQEAFKEGDKIGGSFAETTRHRAAAIIKVLEGDIVGARDAIDAYRKELDTIYANDDPRRESGEDWVRLLEGECLDAARSPRA